MTSEEQEAQEKANLDDKSSIANLMEGVSDDGYSQKSPAGSESAGESEQASLEDPSDSVAEPTNAANEQEEPPEVSLSDPNATPIDDLEQKEGETSASKETGVPEDAPQDDYEREIEAIEAPKGASSKTTEVLKILKKKNREEHRARKAAEAKESEIGKRKFIDDDMQKRIEQLEQLETNIAIEQSPQIQQFRQEVSRHEQDAANLLKQWRLPEDTAKYINDNGGLLKFQASNEPMTDLAGNPIKVDDQYVTQAQWWEKVAKKSMTDAQKEELGDHLSDARRAIREMNRKMTDAKGNPQQFFDKQKQDFDAMVKDYTERADKQLTTEADLYGEIAKPREVPDKAAPELKAEILEHNARLEEAKQSIKNGFGDQTPEHRAKAEAALAYRNFAQNRVKEMETKLNEVTKERDELKSRWDKAKNVAQTSRQQSVVQQQKEKPTPKPYDAGGSIKELMEQIPA